MNITERVIIWLMGLWNDSAENSDLENLILELFKKRLESIKLASGKVCDYSPNQPRDKNGKWTNGGGSGLNLSKESDKIKINYKDKDLADSILTKEAEEWEKGLTGAEKTNINIYSGEKYEAINNYLRGKSDGNTEIKNTIKEIDNALERYELKQDISVLRGTSKEAIKEMTGGKDDFVGKVIKEPAYTSTTVSKEVAKDFAKYSNDTPILMQIDIKAGKGKGAYIKYMAENVGEWEFLIKRGSDLEIFEIGELDGIPLVKARLKA